MAMLVRPPSSSTTSDVLGVDEVLKQRFDGTESVLPRLTPKVLFTPTDTQVAK